MLMGSNPSTPAKLNPKEVNMSTKSKLESLNQSDKTEHVTAILSELARDTLEIERAVREEEQHVLNLVDSYVDKILDLGKLLISVAVPALVALYSLRSGEFDPQPYLTMTVVGLLLGIGVFAYGMLFKRKHIPLYLQSSTLRLRIYTEWIRSATFRAKQKDSELPKVVVSKH